MQLNNYGKSLKSETLVKEDQQKKDAEIQQRKVKIFNEKLKEMRKNMKIKPQQIKNESKKNTINREK